MQCSHPVFAALVLLFNAATTSASPPRPNVILSMTDDQGFADAGFQGHDALRTPHLDALAARGMVLEHFYAQSPVCSPSGRAAASPRGNDGRGPPRTQYAAGMAGARCVRIRLHVGDRLWLPA